MKGLAFISQAEGEGSICLVRMVKSIAISYLITLCSFVLFSILITYTSFSEGYMSTVVMITTLVAIFYAAISSAKGAQSKGWLNGSLAGLMYMVILYLMGFLSFSGFTMDKYSLMMLGLALVIGAVGGIVGINMGRGNRRHR